MTAPSIVRTLPTYAAKEANQNAAWASGITLAAAVPSGNHLILVIGADVGDNTSPHPTLSFNVGTWSRLSGELGTAGSAYTTVKGYVYMAPGPFNNGQQILVTESRTPTTSTNARAMAGFELTNVGSIPSQESGTSGNTTADPVPTGTTNDLAIGAAVTENNAAPTAFAGTGWGGATNTSVASTGAGATTNVGVLLQGVTWSAGIADYNPTTADGGKIAIVITGTAGTNATFTTTTGSAAGGGETGALTGTANATFTTTVGDAAAGGGTGAILATADATFTTTVGNAAAAGGTGMLKVPVVATAGSASGACWVDPTNATGTPDDSYATWTSDVNAATSCELVISNFGTWASIPAGATIDSVEIAIQHHESHTGAPLEFVSAQAYLGSTPLGTATNLTLSLTDRDDVLTPSLTLADLQGNTLAVRIIADRV